MKKIIAIAAMLLMTATAMNAQISFGLKGGLNVTSVDFSNLQNNIDPANQCGFYVGPTVKFSLPVVGLGVDGSVFYNQRVSKLSSDNATVESETIKHQTLSIPLNLRYQIVGIGDTGGLFLFTGPQFDFNIGDKNPIKEAKEWKFKDSDFSWNVGLGVMVLNHLQVNANYNIGLSKTSDIKAGTVTNALLDLAGIKSGAKENTWQIGLAYWF